MNTEERKIWVLQKELEQHIQARAADNKEAWNRIIVIGVIALIEFLWILLQSHCGA